ncbi:MAG: lytic transglycosylase domain-containing protein [Clostridia bacterium]|nr:lytic transglycosylase domain-containing protein [Clostridia bacterium]
MLILILVTAIVFFGGKFVLKTLFPLEHTDIINEAAEAQDIDPYLILALIKAESNFVSDAQSHKDAFGLMQITEPTAKWIAGKMNLEGYTAESLLDPTVNIRMGTWYLGYLISLYNGDETLALCAYNAGLGNVDNWLADKKCSADGKNLTNIPFAETEKYIEKIKRYKETYQKLYPEL